MKSLSLVLAFLVVAACSADTPKTDPKAPGTPSPGSPAAAPAGGDMAAAIKELMAKAEHGADVVEVQHILIAFQGTGTKATRSKADAEALAAKVWAEAKGGADFAELVKKHTDDSFPGIYPMTKQTRSGMVRGFGDVGWRLQPGEIGVAPFDATASPYGWHIIKRTK